LLLGSTWFLATRPLPSEETRARHSPDLRDPRVQANLAMADLVANFFLGSNSPSREFDFQRARLRNLVGLRWADDAREIVRNHLLRGCSKREVEAALGKPVLTSSWRWIYRVGMNFAIDDLCLWIHFDPYGSVSGTGLFELPLSLGELSPYYLEVLENEAPPVIRETR